MKTKTQTMSVSEIESYQDLVKIDKSNMPLEFDLNGEHDEWAREDYLDDEPNVFSYWAWVLIKVQERIDFLEYVEVNFRKDCKNGVYGGEVGVAN